MYSQGSKLTVVQLSQTTKIISGATNLCWVVAPRTSQSAKALAPWGIHIADFCVRRIIIPRVYSRQGCWYFAEKKAKFRGIFRGKFAEKSADFTGFSREKSQNSRNNRPISVDFRRRKVKIRRKIGPFRRILVEKSQFSKDLQGQILRKIGRFHGKFRGETSPRNNQ